MQIVHEIVRGTALMRPCGPQTCGTLLEELAKDHPVCPQTWLMAPKSALLGSRGGATKKKKKKGDKEVIGPKGNHFRVTFEMPFTPPDIFRELLSNTAPLGLDLKQTTFSVVRKGKAHDNLVRAATFRPACVFFRDCGNDRYRTHTTSGLL